MSQDESPHEHSTAPEHADSNTSARALSPAADVSASRGSREVVTGAAATLTVPPAAIAIVSAPLLAAVVTTVAVLGVLVWRRRSDGSSDSLDRQSRPTVTEPRGSARSPE